VKTIAPCSYFRVKIYDIYVDPEGKLEFLTDFKNELMKRKTEESAAGSFRYKNSLTLFHPHFCVNRKITDLRALLATRLGL
jgi:hypothetical protein